MKKVINCMFVAVIFVAIGQKMYAASDEEYFARLGSSEYAQENVNKLNELMAQENASEELAVGPLDDDREIGMLPEDAQENEREQLGQESDEAYFARVNSPEYSQENVRKLQELMVEENEAEDSEKESDEAYFKKVGSSEYTQENVRTLNELLMKDSD